MYIMHDNNGAIIRIDSLRIADREGYHISKDIKIPDEIMSNVFSYRFVDGEFVYDEELAEERKKNTLRAKREPLLTAFDIYKSNVLIGAVSPTDEEKQEVIAWYHEILDLSEQAIDNPPEIIKKYL